MTISLQELGLILRFGERILILVITIFIIKQGIKLLLKSMEGSSQIEYEGTLGRFKITNVATGVILIAMAIIVLGFSLNKVFEFSESSSKENFEHANAIDVNKIDQSNKLKDTGLVAKKNTVDTISIDARKSNKQSGSSSASMNKNTNTTSFKYEGSMAGNYEGPIIQSAIIEKLFNKLKYLKENPDKIDRSELSDLQDIYEEIYNFNRNSKRTLNLNYSPNNLK